MPMVIVTNNAGETFMLIELDDHNEIKTESIFQILQNNRVRA